MNHITQAIKFILIAVSFVVPANMVEAQQVIASAGNYQTHSSGSISYTAGEPVIATYSGGGYILTQGFQQSYKDSVPGPAVSKLYVRVFLQGPYAGGSSMNSDLSAGGYLPQSQPYNVNPWLYNGNEHRTTMPSAAVDWVLIELRSSIDTIIARKAALLYSNGYIYDTSLVAGITFDSVPAGSYYIAIDHRNHMPVMSASPVVVPDIAQRDFSNSASFPLYGGSNAIASLGNGIGGMISGDINKDGTLKYSGPGNDRALILQRIISETGSNSIITTANGYFREDLTMNGNLKYSGPGNDPSRIIQNLVNLTGSTAINTVFNCPVPKGIVK